MLIPERLTRLMKARGLSQSELARRVSVTQQTIGKLANGSSSSSTHLHKIARELGTTPAYLTGETDDPAEGFVPAPSKEAVAEDLGLVPVHEIDLSFGMGATFLDVPVTASVRHFSREWLRQYTHASPDQLFFAQGIGDSMAPTILDSDLLLIDSSQKSLSMADKIWAVAHYGAGKVKRLRPTRDGVMILSDNPLVPAEEATDGELHILGRVVAVVRKM